MEETRKYIKIPRIDGVFDNKKIALEKVQEYVVKNISFFHDGESVLIRFKNDSGDIISSMVFINIDNEQNVALSFNLDSEETIKIVETKGEPSDKDSLWLTEETEGDSEKDNIILGLQNRIESLEKTLSSLSTLIDKHEYALTHTISGGDFLTNSVKYDLENSTETEKPASANYGEVYSENNKLISNFELYIGYTNLKDYESVKLYSKTYYYIRPEFYNSDGELINPKDIHTYELISNNVNSVETRYVEASKRWYLYGLKKDNVIITCKVVDIDGKELIRDYILIFETESEPYSYEPNVKHVLMKTAETFDILSANTKYLLLNEFVWCKGDNSLYFKAEASNGTINLFKINGGGYTPEDPDTGTTEDVVINVDSNDVLELTDNSGNNLITVDNDDTLVISKDIAYVDENGILIFGQTTTGTTDVTYDEETGELNIGSNTASVSEDGILTLVGTIDSNGVLSIGNSGSEIDIVDDTLEVYSEIDEEGYLTLTNVEVDDEGYIIIK